MRRLACRESEVVSPHSWECVKIPATASAPLQLSHSHVAALLVAHPSPPADLLQPIVFGEHCQCDRLVPQRRSLNGGTAYEQHAEQSVNSVACETWSGSIFIVQNEDTALLSRCSMPGQCKNRKGHVASDATTMHSSCGIPVGAPQTRCMSLSRSNSADICTRPKCSTRPSTLLHTQSKSRSREHNTHA